ncbi:MAG: hypothetical protein ABWX76_11515 [Leifsonia flava]
MTRGVLAAAVSTFAAAFSHGVAASEAPSIAALAAASVLAVFVCIALAGRATPLRLSTAVILSQAGFHTLFTLMPALSGSATVSSGHHGMVTLTTDAVTHHHGTSDAGMWLGHAAAAVVTILALRHGERAFLAIADTLRLTMRALVGAIASLPVQTPAAAAPEWLPTRSATTSLLPSSVHRRGPPMPGGVVASVA